MGVVTHPFLVHGALVHLKGKRTDNLNWGRYVPLYPIMAECDDLVTSR